jgi:hypothetical protein
MFESESWYARLRWKIVMTHANVIKFAADLQRIDGGSAAAAQRCGKDVRATRGVVRGRSTFHTGFHSGLAD